MKNLNLLQKRYVIDIQTAKDKYNKSDSLKFETESIKSSLCSHSNTFILVTRDITINEGNDTEVAFKNCESFSTCKIEINNVFIDEANHVYIAMSMYNLNEYSGNYSVTLRSLWQFKRDEVPANDANLCNSFTKNNRCW